MLHIFVNGDSIVMSAEGTTPTITAELLMVVGSVYREIKESDKDLSAEAAEAFKDTFTKAINDNIPFKSNEEIKEEMHKKGEDLLNKLRETLREADN